MFKDSRNFLSELINKKNIRGFVLFLSHALGAYGCYWFLKDVIGDYQEGKTDFRVTQEALTVKDVPTWTLCVTTWTTIPLTYGIDIEISVYNQRAKEGIAVVILKKDSNTVVQSSNDTKVAILACSLFNATENLSEKQLSFV